MTMSKVTGFHVRHDLQPSLTHELLTLVHALPDGQTPDDLHIAAEMRGYDLRERKDYGKLLRSLTELNVVTYERKRVSLSTLGRSMMNVIAYYPHLLPEFIHFLYYTSWDEDQSQRFSWSYRTVCNALWETAPCALDRDQLVNLVTQEAMQHFGLAGVSFSVSSVAGILNWVNALNPSCILEQGQQQIFSRRDYCPVESFALALEHVYRHQRSDDTLYLAISPEVRQSVCRTCLITQEAFDEMLDKTQAHFDSIRVRRERGERYAIRDFSWSQLEE